MWENFVRLRGESASNPANKTGTGVNRLRHRLRERGNKERVEREVADWLQIGCSLQCWDGFGACGVDSPTTKTDPWLYEEDGAHWNSISRRMYILSW